MSGKKRLRFTLRALRNIAAAEEFIAQDAPLIARKVVETIYVTSELLESNALLGKMGRRAGTREVVLSKYPFTIIYRVDANNVRVLAVIHQSKKY